MNEKRVSFKLFSIIKEPRMSAIVYGRGGLNLPYSKVGGPAEGGMKGPSMGPSSASRPS